jgi:hypothetical protein
MLSPRVAADQLQNSPRFFPAGVDVPDAHVNAPVGCGVAHDGVIAQDFPHDQAASGNISLLYFVTDFLKSKTKDQSQRWQATKWPFSTSVREGAETLQESTQRGQRG